MQTEKARLEARKQEIERILDAESSYLLDHPLADPDPGPGERLSMELTEITNDLELLKEGSR